MIDSKSIKQFSQELQIRTDVLNDIHSERNRQTYKWGKQVHAYAVWLTILIEEVGEVAQAIQKGSVASKDTDASDLYTELIQVAAVATAIAEQVKENE
ncbi:MazG-like family protein [Oceanobacillus sp. E9]|uniref:MazG-like family protein n=1 Tax=Oceanobacillus sp. E9 TaxID=1742575 RepID=UPI000ACE6F54|nr:MazG-like family protein [Oceanobacillus sp. E9]